MIVYRVGKKQYSTDLLGEGARLFGGRWNFAGRACLYTSESRALALLEFSVNLNALEIPNLLCFTVIEIPEDNIYEVKLNELPDGWNTFPVTSLTQFFGTNLFLNSNKSIIKIPSAIIANEWNYILNPNHINSNKNKIIAIEDFVYDSRIKL